MQQNTTEIYQMVRLDANAIPFNKIVKIIIDLLKFSKNGISKEEGALLAEDLLDIVMHLKVS